MMILTAKISKKKVVLAIAGLAVLAVVLCLLVRGSGKSETPEGVPVTGISSNEDRIAFLRAYGWEPDSEPVSEQTVLIPEEPNEVLERYITMQEEQGFHLMDYAGKEVSRYVYLIQNYPEAQGDVLATLLIYKNRVIGGDISCQWPGGELHGFAS